MNKLLHMDKPVFSVTITPHRSLPQAGFALLLGTVALFNLGGGIVFWYVGAWPVVGFMGLDVALVWFALRWSRRQARRSEKLTITGSELQFSRYSHDQLLERLTFPRSFVYVDLERDAARDLTGRLFLRSKGKVYEIGSFLGAEERVALAEALHKALVGPKF
jgi:uncharacterized membrane protein